MSYRTLLVDLDVPADEFDRKRYEEWAKKRIEALGNRIIWLSYAVSPGGGVHVSAYLERPISPDQVAVYQLALGSDPIRECYNHFRLKHGVDINVLFSHKKAGSYDPSVKKKRRRIEDRMRCMCPDLLELVELYRKEGLDLLEAPP